MSIASSILGVPMDQVNHYDSDTSTVARGAGTMGSRSLQTAGSGVYVVAEVPEVKSKWHGECFVFDNRVSVNHALEKGSYDQCHACRLPITEADKKSDQYQPGVSCPACFGRKNAAKRGRYREREKQVKLAAGRGESHIGADAGIEGKRRKKLKLEAKQKQRERAL